MLGKVIDRDFRKIAEARGMSIDQFLNNDISMLPIEHARLRTNKYYVALCAPLIAGYGWALELKVVGFSLSPEFIIMS